MLGLLLSALALTAPLTEAPSLAQPKGSYGGCPRATGEAGDCAAFYRFTERLKQFGDGRGTPWSSEPLDLLLSAVPANAGYGGEPIVWPSDWPGLDQAQPMEERPQDRRLTLPNRPETVSALKAILRASQLSRRPIAIGDRLVLVLGVWNPWDPHFHFFER